MFLNWCLCFESEVFAPLEISLAPFSHSLTLNQGLTRFRVKHGMTKYDVSFRHSELDSESK